MGDVHAHYLRDLGHILREAAEKLREEARREDADKFLNGRAFAYYEVVSLMQQQAIAFQLPLSDLAFDGLDPDRDLL
jgi:hypothetical protein